MKRLEPSDIGLAVLIGLYLLYAGNLIPVASENIRMVAAFSIDEADVLFQIDHLYRAGIATPPSFTYGGMLYYPVTLFLHVWQIFRDVDGQAVVLALRWFCALAGGGCLVLTYRIGTNAFDAVTGLGGAFILAVSPEFLRWTVDGHPDLPQLFWILATLWFCCRRTNPDTSHILLAAVCAGLAFGTKYGGIFLLPVIGLAVMTGSEDSTATKSQIARNLQTQARWWTLVTAFGAFILAFAVTNPWSLLRLESFVGVMGDYGEWMQFGHTRREGGGWYTWLALLYGELGPAHSAALVVLAALSGISLTKRTPVRRDRLILASWCLLLLTYLMVQVGLRRPRHLLPIMPATLLFAAWGYRSLALRVFRLNDGEGLANRVGITVGLAAGIVLLSSTQIADSASFYQTKQRQMADRADDLDVGHWLEASAPNHTSMVYDAYAYIPPQFQRVWRSTGTTYMMVSHFTPDLVIVRDGAAEGYADPQAGSEARMGVEAYRDIHFFYRYLREGRLPDYTLHRRFGSVAVYRRTVPPPARTLRWKELAALHQQGKLYGVGQAIRTMGRIHSDLGLHEEAIRADAWADAVEH